MLAGIPPLSSARDDAIIIGTRRTDIFEESETRNGRNHSDATSIRVDIL